MVFRSACFELRSSGSACLSVMSPIRSARSSSSSIQPEIIDDMVTWLRHGSVGVRCSLTAVQVLGRRSLEMDGWLQRLRLRRRAVRDGRAAEHPPRRRSGWAVSSSNESARLLRIRGVDSTTADFAGTGSDVIVRPEVNSVNESWAETLVSNIVNWNENKATLWTRISAVAEKTRGSIVETLTYRDHSRSLQMVPFDSMAVWRWESYLWPYLLAVSTQYANVTLSHRMTARAALYCLARPQSRCKNTLNPLMGTEHSNGPLYSSTVIGTLAVDGQAVTYGTAPSPLLAVPNVTAHPSTASVPTSYYSSGTNCLCTL